MNSEPQVFHVGVSNPLELRKEILLTQKDIVTNLKKYEFITNLRAEKEMRTSELKKILVNLRTTIRKLSTALPAKQLPKRKIPTPQPQLPAPHKKVALPKAPSQLQHLESQLSQIEQRLEDLE